MRERPVFLRAAEYNAIMGPRVANRRVGQNAMKPKPEQVTRFLNAVAAGDPGASQALLPLVYDELRALAQQRLAQEPGGQTLQPTALVHEAYLRLSGEREVRWEGRGHFFAAAAQAMRRIMIERARKYAAEKHGGGRKRLPLDEEMIGRASFDETTGQLLELDEALTRLEERDPRKAQIVMHRFFAGLSIEQTAAAMALSPATVKYEWRFARAWLYSEMGGDGGN